MRNKQHPYKIGKGRRQHLKNSPEITPEEELEIIKGIDKYRTDNKLNYVTNLDVVRIMKSLGWSKK